MKFLRDGEGNWEVLGYGGKRRLLLYGTGGKEVGRVGTGERNT